MTLDAFASRYGWTEQQLDEQPQAVIEEMPMLWKAQTAAQRAGQLAERARAAAYAEVAPKRRR